MADRNSIVRFCPSTARRQFLRLVLRRSAPAAGSSEPFVAVELDHPFGQPLGIALALSCDLECALGDQKRHGRFTIADTQSFKRDLVGGNDSRDVLRAEYEPFGLLLFV